MDTRRHAPLGRVRVRLAPHSTRSRPHAYLGRAGRPLAELYASDHADSRQSGRFRWLLSTCLAAAVGVLAILVVIAGAADSPDGEGSMFDWTRLPEASFPSWRRSAARIDGLRWAIPKSDKLTIPSGAMATKFVIFDGIRQRRGNRDYIQNKPYVRIVARLAPVSKRQAQTVPQFNPFKLYANTTPLDENERPDTPREAEIRILELNGVLPSEDGLELDAQEVAALVARAQATEDSSGALSGGELLAERAQRAADAPAPQTTILRKTVFEPEEPAVDAGDREMPPVKVQRGDTLARILSKQGAQTWQARAMVEAGRPIFAENALLPGYEVRTIVVPSVGKPGGFEPARFSVFDEGGAHKVTVSRSATGDYVSSASRVEERVPRVALPEADQAQDNSLYASLFYTAAKQGVAPDLIMQILRIHAYETDFRQRVRAGDGLEFFFDVKDEDRGIDGSLGELLATSVTSGGETAKFYRFRTTDGTVDFYDGEGSTSRKFLTRRPVRGEDVRITSGFGLRRHPLLQQQKMHYGVDWACAHGTPILAAGNGIIEEAGAKGEYGNYVRIRHANGYKTAYGHMSRFGAGVSSGVRVRQGQVIGYVGSTGLSSGPHLHFEVLVNGVHVNPMSIQVPNDRQLTAKDLADFKREKTRIDELMRRHPVSTRVAAAAVQ